MSPQIHSELSIPTTIYIKKETLLCRWNENDSKASDPAEYSGSSCVSCSRPVSEPLRLINRSNPCTDPMGKTDACAPPVMPLRRSGSIAHSRDASVARLASLQSGININDVRLLPVHFDPDNQGKKKLAPNLATPLSQILALNQDKTISNSMTAVFCIRREGCGSCRDHGLELAKIVKQSEANVKLVGIIKKTNADPSLLEEFYSQYFPFPIYQDDQWDAFKFLGRRKVSPWQLLSNQPRILKRYQENKIKNVPLGGDIFTQGGILLFDSKGSLRYVYYERYGDRLDTSALVWAMDQCHQETV